MNKFYVYLHCKPDEVPFYVGKGTFSRSQRLSSRNQYHKNIVAKYGKKNIKIYVFECDSEEQAFSDEVQWIECLTKQGYELSNMTIGGEGVSGHKHSEETKARLSEANRNRKGEKRQPHSEERKQEISELTKTALLNPEIRKKIHNSLLGNKNSLGRIHPDEVKAKIAESTKQALSNPEIRAKMSVSHTGKKRGPMSEEQKAKLRLAHLGKKLSPEHKAKISESGKGTKRPPVSEETRKKLSEAAKNQHRSKQG